MTAPFPPIRREPRAEDISLKPEDGRKAVELVRGALPLFRAGEPIAHPDHVDVPVFYLDFAIDMIHYDGKTKMPRPRGAPPHGSAAVNRREAREVVDRVLKEARVLDAAEFREPEDCWVVPIAWKSFIIFHVRVSREGEELIPDYGLTEEVRRYGTF
ncbi:hypothetical protein [Thermococcus sp.]|uniref:hypothetical protein n=1 Tax=Thermococcus sp. TaxID=35749 RepID=UPI00260335AB|nr:hypothetical protein [Thermococcus sp.]